MESQVDFELCQLSISYLIFPDFGTEFDQFSMDQSVLSGRCAFYEYAVTCWHLHLMSWLSYDKKKETELDELKETLVPFLELHFVNEGSLNTISSAIHGKLKSLKNFEHYDSLTQAVIWGRKQLMVGSSNEQLFDFTIITSNIRTSLERIVQQGLTVDRKATLESYYGPHWFKCPRMFCRHYFDGFTSQSSRDHHVSRHDRAYICTFDGCPTAIFGCVTRKDLETHLLESHGVLPELADNDEFPRIARPKPESQMTEKHMFRCGSCPKRFTRKFNLRQHERTHTNERPFVCPVCNLTFVRRHDQLTHLKRHDPIETQNTEAEFRCQGDLNTGEQWGCGRTYKREQDFARHLRSDVGKKCIQPLLDQVAKEKEQENGEQSLGNHSPVDWLESHDENADAMDFDFA